MNGKITISKRGMQKGTGEMCISIDDANSGMCIIEVSMSLLDFADAITGLGGCDCKLEHIPNKFLVENIGRKKIMESIKIPKFKGYGKEEQKAYIAAQIADSGLLDDGWMVWSDGCSSQQNGTQHVALLYKYVDAEDEELK